MKVLLLYAKSKTIAEKAAELFADQSKSKGELARDEIYPPLGITILGQILLDKGYEVRLHDDSIDAFDEIRASVEWADVIGISSLTPNARRARELGKLFKDEYGKPVILGGPHPTTNPEYFLEAGAADVCCQGEGDYTLPELLEVIHDRSKWGDVQGITFLEDGELFRTPRRALVSQKEMDAIPFPAYHLWDMDKFMSLMVHPGVTVFTSRGCPYACTFCDAEMTPRQYRSMSPERTVDLLEQILVTYNPPQIAFLDDLFTIQRKRVIAICKEIIKRDLFFEWSCESRVDTMDFEMLRWMKKAGCVKVYYGLESGSPNMLNRIKKGVTIDKVLRGARINREVGMYYKFFLIYGFPEDTVEDHVLTEQVIAQTMPNAICVGILQPIPGTEIFEQLKPLLIKDVAEIDFHYWHATETFKHPNFSFDELHQERERLLKMHAKHSRTLGFKLRRKLDRVVAMIRHPELIGDLFEVRARRRRYRQRLQTSKYYESMAKRDAVRQQVPRVVLD